MSLDITELKDEQFVHEFRKYIDKSIKIVETDLEMKREFDIINSEYMRAMSLVRTKLQEAKLWAGKGLEALGSELPKEFRDKAE